MIEKPRNDRSGDADRDLVQFRRGSGGESAYIAGTRVRVSDIARLYRLAEEELVIDRIQHALPHLTLQQIRAAIEYWRSHQAQIDGEIAEERAILANIPTKE